MKSFLAGAFSLLAIELLGAYLFLTLGGLPLATKAPPLPFEEKIADYAISKYLKGSENLNPPNPVSEVDLRQGAEVYKDQCAFCHGLPNRSKPMAAAGMFPPPPQFFTQEESAAQFPTGSLYWIIKYGIRLSGMPAFENRLEDGELWQTAILLKNSEKLPSSAQEVLK